MCSFILLQYVSVVCTDVARREQVSYVTYALYSETRL